MTTSEKRPRTDAQRRAEAKYKAGHYKRIPLDVHLDDYGRIKAEADRAGMSVNAWVKMAISEKMAEDGRRALEMWARQFAERVTEDWPGVFPPDAMEGMWLIVLQEPGEIEKTIKGEVLRHLLTRTGLPSDDGSAFLWFFRTVYRATNGAPGPDMDEDNRNIWKQLLGVYGSKGPEEVKEILLEAERHLQKGVAEDAE